MLQSVSGVNVVGKDLFWFFSVSRYQGGDVLLREYNKSSCHRIFAFPKWSRSDTFSIQERN